MITQERMEAALNYLAESDDDFAVAKADLLRAEIVCKRTRARLYLETTGSVDERKGKVECFPAAIEVDELLVQATIAFEKLKAQRQRAEIVIDVWRSINDSMRRS